MSKEKSGMSKYVIYSGLGIQMGVIIGVLTWFGTFLDEKYATQPLWTVILSLSGVAIALYLVIREVLKMSKDENEK